MTKDQFGTETLQINSIHDSKNLVSTSGSRMQVYKMFFSYNRLNNYTVIILANFIREFEKSIV